MPMENAAAAIVSLRIRRAAGARTLAGMGFSPDSFGTESARTVEGALQASQAPILASSSQDPYIMVTSATDVGVLLINAENAILLPAARSTTTHIGEYEGRSTH